MRILCSLLLVLFLAFPAFPEDKVSVGAPGSIVKSVTIDAPSSFARDKMILFKLNGIEGTKARMKWWVRSDDGKSPPDFQVFDDGKICAVWAGPGKYEVLVTVGIIEQNDITWFDVEHKFVVDGTGPNPPPGPDPPPAPGAPPGDFGDVTDVVRNLADPVKDADGKAAAATIIATAYRKHGALAAKGEYKDQNTMADATSAEFVYELGLNRYVRWRPMMTRLREHMAQLMKDGKLKDKDMQAWSKLWEAYAVGFDAVAKAGATPNETKK